MMTLTECKQLMNWYRNDAEAGIVQFNWRTTARWSLRHRWSQEENVKLQAALQDATKRAEAAEAALAAMKPERDYWEARCRRAESEAFAADSELDIVWMDWQRRSRD